MKLRTLLCSEVNLLDAATNKVSCINLIDDLSLPQFPFSLGQIGILTIFSREDGDLEEHTAEVILTLEDEELARGPLMIAFQGSQTARTFVNLVGLTIPKAGIFKVSVRNEQEEMGSWNVSIAQIAPEITQVFNPAV